MYWQLVEKQCFIQQLIRSRRSFIAILKVNRDVFSNLPERIEQWLEKETSATNQPETTEHRFVRPH